ncbi:hypothetical protein CFP65_5918 [Kitasatospora sp. MMS16-BH015]|uniref:hemerythrin domain-containing protein n=1 Tax=Kitasatospora sp. MMS16-BH015 TaxID=2018025 RepID=UPI000CA27D26|nr:hemerythrin domain-containing protein [Kitasatospora sp. MMS16-BH015]AUG80596.1 hypothetical protein CFP65_5918 [Kitasatospora sp. MMS16-BH015]
MTPTDDHADDRTTDRTPSRATSRTRLNALGAELHAIHRGLRAELTRLRTEVAAHLAGHGPRPRELRAHCLAFCAALTTHHTGEDAGAFPALAAAHPELRPVIAKLTEDHGLIAGILRSLDQLLTGLPDHPTPAEATRIQGELDGLAAILESHFGFEERRITAALDALPASAGTPVTLLGAPPG